MHEKLVLIDDSVVWTGSLNTLSFSNTQEIMERRQDRELFRDYSSQMYIDKMLEPAEHPEEQRCPICGAEIIAAESDKGGIYWRCVNNDYSRNVDQKYPHDGKLTCKKCNSKLTFSMINEPRWICAANDKHYQKVRRGDLNLPKMLEKIPMRQRKTVARFFKQ